ncbi:MAG: phenylalanine--tRNA ligase subunit alpha [Bacilli bacterium]
MELDRIQSILNEALDDIEKASTKEEIVGVRNKYFAKKSELMSFMSLLGTLSIEEKKKYGQEINLVKGKISEALNKKDEEISNKLLEEKLAKEQIDISLPGKHNVIGGKNPFFVVQDEIVNVFVSMGFEVEEGPEVEKDRYNFELLNIPHDHPARDMQDSFYIDDNLLLRTQTSAVQARTMEAKKGQPIKMICPGKTYRRDDDDMTHSHQFAQIEGLVVDKDINLGNLKATLELFVKKMFGEKRSIRMRSSFFPFTEPSVEIDISCASCGGKGCPMCKGTGYIEILGGGMVHPNVLRMNGYDPDVYSGFAFGLGVERVALLRYGIDDIRKLYTNDVRFLHQFKKQ